MTCAPLWGDRLEFGPRAMVSFSSLNRCFMVGVVAAPRGPGPWREGRAGCSAARTWRPPSPLPCRPCLLLPPWAQRYGLVHHKRFEGASPPALQVEAPFSLCGKTGPNQQGLGAKVDRGTGGPTSQPAIPKPTALSVSTSPLEFALG